MISPIAMTEPCLVKILSSVFKNRANVVTEEKKVPPVFRVSACSAISVSLSSQKMRFLPPLLSYAAA